MFSDIPHLCVLFGKTSYSPFCEGCLDHCVSSKTGAQEDAWNGSVCGIWAQPATATILELITVGISSPGGISEKGTLKSLWDPMYEEDIEMLINRTINVSHTTKGKLELEAGGEDQLEGGEKSSLV